MKYCVALAALCLALLSTSSAYGETPSQEAARLTSQGADLYRQGRARDAIPLQEHAVSILESNLPPGHPDIIEALRGLGTVYLGADMPQKAKPILERAVQLSETAFGKDAPGTALSVSLLGSAHANLGDYTGAEPLFQRALAIFENQRKPPDGEPADTLNNLGSLYYHLGVYASAEPLLERAMRLTEAQRGRYHADTAISLSNLAVLYETRGRFDKAEPLYEQAVEAAERVHGKDHPDTTIPLNNLAHLYLETGAREKALNVYQRVLMIRERDDPDSLKVALVLNNIAELYRRSGQFDEAEPVLKRALTLYEKQASASPDTATALNNLGLLYHVKGDFPRAEQLYERALELREAALGPDHPDTANSIGSLGGLYLSMGAYSKALPFYERALGIQRRIFGPDHPDVGLRLSSLATLYEDSGAPEKAESLYDQAQAIEEANTARFLLTGSEARKLENLRGRTWHVQAVVAFSLSHPTAASQSIGLAGVLQFKGRVLDSMADTLVRLRASVNPQDRARLDELSIVAQERSKLIFRGSTGANAPDYAQRLAALSERQDALESELAARSATFRDTFTPIKVASVAQVLPADSVLLEQFRYFTHHPGKTGKGRWGTPHYMVYVLKAGAAPIGIDLGDAGEIEQLVDRYRAALGDARAAEAPTREETAQLAALGAKLHALLIAPLAKHLEGSRRLLLSPDGALNLLPFAALPVTNNRSLGEQFEVTYLTSGRDLLRMKSAAPRGSTPLVLADPDFEATGSRPQTAFAPSPDRALELDRSGIRFSRLAGTAFEADDLGQALSLGPDNVLTGARATEARLRAAHSPRLLHIATHGFFLSTRQVAELTPPSDPGVAPEQAASMPNPLLRSGLALAGANKRQSGGDDGILTAAEIAQLDLSGTQLAVLSACETGLGSIDSAEGVYGLRRALVLAGARAQLVSLWKVSDSATRELMRDYYALLLEGKGSAAALREAQRLMRARPGRSHPYYWAAFVPIGDWRPMALR